MKAPDGKRPLAAIQGDINQWVKEHTESSYKGASEEVAADYLCADCGAVIQQTTLYASVHDGAAVFGGNKCIGSGQVIQLPLPYCPSCEPEMASGTQRTCIHEEAA